MTEEIRRAVPEDSADITAMIHGLAEFERAPDQCTVTETQISTALFSNSPTVHGHVAVVDGEVAAMALWFLSFSTWDGVAGIYLEIGKAHLACDELVEAFEALDFGFAVDWRVGDVALLLGLVACDLDQEKAAVRAFSAVTTLPPRKEPSGPGADAATKAIAFYHLAAIALAQGDLAKARRLATKAVNGDPSHGRARALFEKLGGQPSPADAPNK